MRGDNIRSVLLGFGLGLVCISVLLIYIFSHDNPGNHENITGGDQTRFPVYGEQFTGEFINPLDTSDRIILLDGDTPRQLTESEKTEIGNMMIDLAADNTAKIKKMVSSQFTEDDIVNASSPEASTRAAAAHTETTAPAALASATTAQAATTATATVTTTTTAPTTAIATTTAATTAPATTTATTQTTAAASTATTTPATTATTTPATTSTTTPATTTTTTAAPTTTNTPAATATTATGQLAETTRATSQSVPSATLTVPTAYLEIVRGDTATKVANKLLNLGLITDTASFLNRLSELGLTGELLDGTYQLPYDLDLNTLIDKITVHK